MPELKKFYEAHKGDDRFEIVAFHDARARNFDYLDHELTKRQIRERYWGGGDLPFPVLLDATGETIKRYGVHAFPTTILLDPKGRLVGRSNRVQLLEQALAGELPPVRPRRGPRKPSKAELADSGWQALPAPESERMTMFRLSTADRELELPLLFRSEMLNPARAYIPASARETLAAVVREFWSDIRAASTRARQTHSKELQERAAAGKLTRVSDANLTDAQKQEVQSLAKSIRRMMPMSSEKDAYRTALQNWFMRQGYTGLVSSANGAFVARPEDLPKTLRERRNLAALQIRLVTAIAGWFQDQGALTDEEARAAVKRFARHVRR